MEVSMEVDRKSKIMRRASHLVHHNHSLVHRTVNDTDAHRMFRVSKFVINTTVPIEVIVLWTIPNA